MGKQRARSVYRGMECIFTHVKPADDMLTRLRGLMFYRNMPGIDGLLLYPCQSVHMFWMHFPLDLIYLDRNGRVIRLVRNLAVNKLGPFDKSAFYILEVAAGSIAAKNIKAGDALWW